MNSPQSIARALASAFLAGPLVADQLVERGAVLLGKRWGWLRPLATRVCATFGTGAAPRRIALVKFLLADERLRRAICNFDIDAPGLLAFRPVMCPIDAADEWSIPPLATTGALAEWLGVSVGELEWFADCKSLESKRAQGRLRHYHYRALVKRFGQIRLIESPKPRLKQIQRQVLAEILEQIPVHPAAHGFRKSHSIQTFVAPHVGRSVVVKLDLRDFFPSIRVSRVQAVFCAAGFPDGVASLLAGLCTNATPLDVWDDIQPDIATAEARVTSFRYAQPHLPQGAPTSPALANLCAYRLDCRLAGLAAAVGATYTRYADDLAFSGDADFSRSAKRFCLGACAIAIEEGFQVHHRKTRVMRSSVRQRLAGLVVNQQLNVMRADYDRLKATLTNCARHGAESQNREQRPDFQAHLLGRISFIEAVNPARGARLQALFDQIRW